MWLPVLWQFVFKLSFNGHNSEICTRYAVLSLFCCCDVASSEDNDSDSSDTESSSHNNKTQNTARTEQPPARILSDQELNQLGAKILRAEMMGDQVHVFYIILIHTAAPRC